MDSFCRCLCSCNGCNIRHLRLNCCFTQIAVVLYSTLADRRIYDELDFSVCNHIGNIRASFVKLVCLNRRHTCRSQISKGSACCNDLKSISDKALCHFNHFVLILIIHGNQNGAF